jgi:hypothetical protein
VTTTSAPTLTLLPAPAGELTTVARPPRRGRRTLTVSLGPKHVRVVAFVGSRPVAWGVLDREPGALQLPALRRFLTGRSARVVDLPFYSTITRFMPLPQVARKHLALVIDAEVAGLLPFEQNEADVRWATLQTDRGGEIAATGMLRHTADAHLEGAAALGLLPTAAHTRAIALALATGHPVCVAAWLENGAADLVLVRGGIPRLTHRVELPAPGDPAAWASALAMGAAELCASEAPPVDDDLPAFEPEAPAPLVLMGEPPASEALSALAGAYAGGILPAQVSLEAVEGFDPAAFGVNVGLHLAAGAARTGGRRGAQGRALAIDLLPERHRHHPKVRRQTVLASLVGLVLLAGPGQSYLTLEQARAAADGLETRVVSLEAQARVTREGASAIERLRARIPVVAEQADALEERMERNLSAARLLRERIAAVTTAPPVRGATVTELTLDPATGRIAGTAPTVSRVLAVAEGLRASGLFSTVTVRDMNDVSSGTDSVVRFTLDLTLPASAP